jgi:hypothetical protein
MTDVSEFKIEKYDGTIYTYPAAAHWTGRILSASTISCIPIAAIIVLIKARVCTVFFNCTFVFNKYTLLRDLRGPVRIEHLCSAWELPSHPAMR